MISGNSCGNGYRRAVLSGGERPWWCVRTAVAVAALYGGGVNGDGNNW